MQEKSLDRAERALNKYNESLEKLGYEKEEVDDRYRSSCRT